MDADDAACDEMGIPYGARPVRAPRIAIGVIVGVLIWVAAWVVFDVCSSHCGVKRTPSCLSNIKMTGTALLMYAVDYDDRLPRSGGWMDAVTPYIKSDEVLRCLAMDQTAGPKYGFALNSLVAARTYTAEREPSRTVLLFDSWKSERSAADALESFAEPGRHHGCGSVLFLDVHAKSLAPLAWHELTAGTAYRASDVH